MYFFNFFIYDMQRIMPITIQEIHRFSFLENSPFRFKLY